MPQPRNERRRPTILNSHIDEESTSLGCHARSRADTNITSQRPKILAAQDEGSRSISNRQLSAETARPEMNSSYSESSTALLRSPSDETSRGKTRWPNLSRFRNEDPENSQPTISSSSVQLPARLFPPVLPPREKFGLFILKDQDPDGRGLVEYVHISSIIHTSNDDQYRRNTWIGWGRP